MGGLVTCEVSKDTSSISVEMGQVSFHSDIIPIVKGDAREVLNEDIVIKGETYQYFGATIGNPHCVVPLPEISQDLALLGPELKITFCFQPYQCSTLQILDRIAFALRSGKEELGTLYGSSSSAAGAVARKMGACDENITVEILVEKLD